MRIALAADHAGFSLKETLRAHLTSLGHEALDFGTHSEERCDYPDFAKAAAEAVNGGTASRGVLVCGSGIGMCIAANRFPLVRAAVLRDSQDAELSRRHNDANVACFGARMLPEAEVMRLLDLFLATPFDGGRHEARVAKLGELR
jgi:ribose 5-phosphate isomerase B